MKYPSLKFLEKLNVAALPTEELAYYAYALMCCQYPASVVSGKWYQMVDDVCSRKIAELRPEIKQRGNAHALAVLDGDADLVKDQSVWQDSINFSELSVCELVGLHSMSKYWFDIRQRNKMEVFTRVHQWRIISELANRKNGRLFADILYLVESLEADNYAHVLNLPYNIGARPKVFSPYDYAGDDDLTKHIYALHQRADFISREELIQIADYIQTEIVAKGNTACHLNPVDAIIGSDTPSFDYPEIVKAYEKTVKDLDKSKDKPEIELAPYFYNLWRLTQKPTYLSRFEKALRRCYLTLASDKHYPNLGINKNDSDSLEYVIQFLDNYRLNLWIINDKYDVDKVIAKYKPVPVGC